MKRKITLLIFFVPLLCLSQKAIEDFGYRHFKIAFQQDSVDVLVRTKKGEEHLKKPIIFEVQGSSAVPLIVHNGKKRVSYVSLVEGFAEDDYHLVLVGKPGLPLMIHKDSLTKGKYKDPKTKKYPQKYLSNNNLEYYVERNNAVMNFLKTEDWVDKSKIVVAGHSEGSTIAAYMADKIDGITHLIYSGGTPYYSRIISMVQQDRRREIKDDTTYTHDVYDYWRDVVKYPFALDRNEGWNTNFGTMSFSQNENEVLKRLNIPILISYGTLDEGAPFCDMLNIETIKDRYSNFTYKAYVGLDHYYRKVNSDSANADKLSMVVNEWLVWLNEN